MTNGMHRTLAALLAAAGVSILGAAAACAPGQDGPGAAPPARIEGPAAERFAAAGKQASLAVLPTRVAGRAMPPVGEAVAMMLERGGMTALEVSEAAFTPPEGADAAETARAFAEFIRTNPPASAYALYTEFLGTPRAGITEVRAAVASREGELVWQDWQAKGDADFDRAAPREPLDGCLFVAQRLRPILRLDDPKRAGDSAGPIAQRWSQKTGVPDKAEMAGIEARGEAFHRAAAASTLLVYAAHAGNDFNLESAKAIAAQVNEKRLAKAVAAEGVPAVQIERGMNEAKVLWSMARGFSAFIRQTKPDADYSMMADYIMGTAPDGTIAVGGVHFVICDRAGEIVAVDLQNSHWPDFKSIAPKSREDCDRLVVKRLAAVGK